MKKPYKDIYTVLKINRIIVISVLVASVLISGYALFLNAKMWHKSRNEAFAINNDGDIIPLKMISQRENFTIEAKAHLYDFHNLFYEINQNNYEKNIEKALWLGDASIEEAHKQRLTDGTYNRLIQYSLLQKVKDIQIQVIGNNEPFEFYTKTIFEINRGVAIDTYELITQGNLVLVDRNFPHNTHGILITNFFEKSLKKIENIE